MTRSLFLTMAIFMSGMAVAHADPPDSAAARVHRRYPEVRVSSRPGELVIQGRIPVPSLPDVVAEFRAAPRGSDARLNAGRRIAEHFIADHREMLAMSVHEEHRERSSQSDGVSTSIAYDRYINNLRLDEGNFVIGIGPDGDIDLIVLNPEAFHPSSSPPLFPYNTSRKRRRCR